MAKIKKAKQQRRQAFADSAFAEIRRMQRSRREVELIAELSPTRATPYLKLR